MQVRTQLIAVGLIAAAWLALQFPSVVPFAHQRAEDREVLSRLESQLETHPDDITAARALSARYLDLALNNLLLDKIARTALNVQRDPRVAFHTAIAFESRGDLNAADAHVNRALNLCMERLDDPVSYREAGCDSQTQAQLVVEAEVIDILRRENIDPSRDPERARKARERVQRPVRLGGF